MHLLSAAGSLAGAELYVVKDGGNISLSELHGQVTQYVFSCGGYGTAKYRFHCEWFLVGAAGARAFFHLRDIQEHSISKRVRERESVRDFRA